MEPDLSQTSHGGDTHFPRAVPFSMFSSHLQACPEQLLLSCSQGAQEPPGTIRKEKSGGWRGGYLPLPYLNHDDFTFVCLIYIFTVAFKRKMRKDKSGSLRTLKTQI